MSSVGRRIKRAMGDRRKAPAWWPKPKDPLPLIPTSLNPDAWLFPTEHWSKDEADRRQLADYDRRLGEMTDKLLTLDAKDFKDQELWQRSVRSFGRDRRER